MLSTEDSFVVNGMRSSIFAWSNKFILFEKDFALDFQARLAGMLDIFTSMSWNKWLFTFEICNSLKKKSGRTDTTSILQLSLKFHNDQSIRIWSMW